MLTVYFLSKASRQQQAVSSSVLYSHKLYMDFFFLMFIFEREKKREGQRERERVGEGQREKGIEDPKRALCCQQQA